MSHPNDTLNGRLHAHELPDERHQRHRFGYWHMVEERMVRAELIAAGHDPHAIGFFSLVTQRIEANHANDPKPWKDGFRAVRQQAAFERGTARDNVRDEAVAALREIEAGHNDPRSLARAVLAKLDALDGP